MPYKPLDTKVTLKDLQDAQEAMKLIGPATPARAGATGSWEPDSGPMIPTGPSSLEMQNQATASNKPAPYVPQAAAPVDPSSVPSFLAQLGGTQQSYPIGLGGVESAMNKAFKPQPASPEEFASMDAQSQSIAAAQEAEMRTSIQAQNLVEQQRAEQQALAQQRQKAEAAAAEFDAQYAAREARVRHSGAGAGVSDQEIQDTEALAQGRVPSSSPAEIAAAKKRLAEWDDEDPFRSSVFGKSGGHIMAAIASALGAYGATIGRTPNFAAQIIEAAIDRNIAGIAARKGEARQALEREYKVQLDKKSDLAQVKMLQFQGAQNLINTLKLQASSADQIAKYDALLGGIETRKQDLRLNGHTASLDEQVKAGGVLAHIAGIKQQYAARVAEAMKAALPGKSPIPDTDLVQGNLPLTDKSVEFAQNYLGRFEVAKSAMDKLIAMRQAAGGYTLFNREEVAEAKAIAAEAILAIKEMKNMGASFTKNEEELITAGVPRDPTEFGWVADKLAIARKSMVDGINKTLRPRNLFYKPVVLEQAHYAGQEGGR